jgi:voltage-gated potassium channel Kch
MTEYKNNQVRKRYWLIITITIGLTGAVFGFTGFMHVYDQNAWNSAYSTLRLFLVNFDAPVTDYPWYLEASRWLAAFAVFSSIFQAGTIVFHKQLQYYRLSRLKGHTVVCGLNQYSMNLIKDLLENKKSVVVIDNGNNEQFRSTVQGYKGISITGDPRNEYILKQANVKNCKYFIIFSENDTHNMDICLRAKNIFLDWHDNGRSPKVLIHLFEYQLEPIVDKLDEEINSSGINLQIFNIHQNAAKSLFEEYPIYRYDKGDLHLIIAGFSQLGEQVLLQAAKVAHFGDGRKLTVTVIDKDIKQKESWFKVRYPNISEVCTTRFLEGDFSDQEVYSHMLEEKLSPMYVTICLEDDETSIIQALFLTKKFRGIPIVAKISEDITLADWIKQDNEQFANISWFGEINSVASEEIVLNERNDKLAKNINAFYKSKYGGKEWWELSMFLRGSNRAQADHMDTKLHLLGLVKTKKNDENAMSWEEYCEHIQTKYHQLAEAEHERWNAYHFINDWEPCSPEVPRNRDLKIHPALVKWTDLDKVSAAQNDDYKQKDIDTVYYLYEILERNGNGIKRLTE